MSTEELQAKIRYFEEQARKARDRATALIGFVVGVVLTGILVVIVQWPIA